MNINRERKEKQVQEIQDDFAKNPSFYMLNFNKMSVVRANELRQKLRENSYSLKVVKNRLALRAIKENFPEELKGKFSGPTALAYAENDPVGLAKLIKEFSIQNKILTVKAAILEGQYMPGENFDEIAKLSSKEDLVAKIGYMMAYPLMQLFRAWQAPLSGFGRLLSQLKDKK